MIEERDWVLKYIRSEFIAGNTLDEVDIEYLLKCAEDYEDRVFKPLEVDMGEVMNHRQEQIKEIAHWEQSFPHRGRYYTDLGEAVRLFRKSRNYIGDLMDIISGLEYELDALTNDNLALVVCGACGSHTATSNHLLVNKRLKQTEDEVKRLQTKHLDVIDILRMEEYEESP